MRVGLPVLVVGLVAGAAVGMWQPDAPALAAGAVFSACLLLVLHARRVRQPGLVAAAAFGACAAVGSIHASRTWHRTWRPTLRVVFESIVIDVRAAAAREQRRQPEEPSAAVLLTGVLASDAALTASGAVSLVVDVEWLGRLGSPDSRTDAAANPVDGRVLLTVLGALGAERLQEWRAGRRIRAPADLHRVARYLNPGVPDQERALARRGVTLVGSIKSGALVDLLARAGPVDEAAASIRSFTRRAIADAVATWNPRAAAIVSAIVIGDRTGLDDSVERRLQEAGTYHVIAISGGNIAILAALTVAAFRLGGILGRAAMLSAAALLAAYGYVVAGSASVTRAVLMAVIYFVARAWDLRGPPMQILLLTAALLVLVDPLSVADTGALLTFGATAALIASGPLVPLERVPAVMRPGLALLLATVAAEAALLPVAASVFSRVTFAGLLLNFAAIPLMAVAQLAGMAVVPLYALSTRVARLAGWAAYIGAEGLVRSADLVALAPWSTWRVAPPPAWLIASYYTCLVVSVRSWGRCRDVADRAGAGGRLRRAAAAGVAVSGLWLVAPPDLSSHGDGRLHVTFIDVGQGDATLVRLPHGTVFLIDAGGLPSGASFDIGDRIVGPVLRHEGVRRLASLVLTHGDADHVGGALSVLRDFRPWDVWDGVPVPPSLPMQRLREEAMSTNTRWTTVQRADRVLVDEVEIAVRHPPLPDWERQDVRNEDSIVLELRWRDVSFVFTGDIGREAEAQLIGQFAPAPLRVVKVPHHGSATSSSEAFVRALAPDVAVVSAGRSNNFGHPSPVVLSRYREASTAIFRTDQDGAVMVDTNGMSLEISSHTGRVLQVPSGPKHHQNPNQTNSSRPRRHEGTKDSKHASSSYASTK